MTARETKQLQDFIRGFETFRAEDKAWKENITNELKPILQERLEREIVSKYGKSAWKVFVAIVGAFAAIGAVANYLVKPYLLHIK